jgi:protein MpaA
MAFHLIDQALSVNGEKIEAYKNTVAGEKYFYLIAGVHGDEVEGVHVLKELFTWLRTHNPQFPIIVIPCLNVDGFKKKTRVNANGVDLNRNLPSSKWSPEAREEKYFPGTKPLSEPENQFLVTLFEKYPPKFIISMHSWYPVLNFNSHCVEVAEFLAQYNKYPLDGDLKGHPTPGSLGEYGPENYSAPVLTMEFAVLSETVTLESIWNENKEGLTKLFTTGFINTFKK